MSGEANERPSTRVDRLGRNAVIVTCQSERVRLCWLVMPESELSTTLARLPSAMGAGAFRQRSAVVIGATQKP